MQVNDILIAAGIPNQEAQYPDPPEGTYAVYFDDIELEAPDHLAPGVRCIVKHDATIELYEPVKDNATEAALEAQLISQGIPWTKQARYWLGSTRRYQVIYEFSYTTKSKKEDLTNVKT